MPCCCEKFTVSHRLRFIAANTLLILTIFKLSCHRLPFVDTITHLGDLLHFNLSDAPDINFKLNNMVKKAYYVLVTFPYVGSRILTQLFQFYCLSSYGSNLWLLSSPALHSTKLKLHLIRFFEGSDVCLDSHTGIVHSVAKLYSLYNVSTLTTSDAFCHELLLACYLF